MCNIRSSLGRHQALAHFQSNGRLQIQMECYACINR